MFDPRKSTRRRIESTYRPRSVWLHARMEAKLLTLARKLDVVHRQTVTSNSPRPMVLLATFANPILDLMPSSTGGSARSWTRDPVETARSAAASSESRVSWKRFVSSSVSSLGLAILSDALLLFGSRNHWPALPRLRTRLCKCRQNAAHG